MILQASGAVLGIDVGYSKQRSSTTAACLLAWTPAAATLRVQAGNVIEFAKAVELEAVALDGPIRGKLDRIPDYRKAEKMLTRKFQRIGKPGQTSSGNGQKLNAAANELAREVRAAARRIAPARHEAKLSMNEAIVEAFPTSFLGVMLDESQIPKGGARSDSYYEHLLGPRAPVRPTTNRLCALLERLLPGRSLPHDEVVGERDHDKRAAIVCAMTALCVAARKYVAVGDDHNGHIILPPRARGAEPGLQDWAWRILEENKAEAGDLICEG